ncbi:hypothetical protein [Lewinella sp. IMCC34191]|uniref:hypothetical protein n=1 Tax=Lewinella sp. IMCC34191 TaxID=2259172 RepID=UPI000E2865B3|nr:hypothetical protein [Lewinella sp. IMCC34191]
MADKMYLIVGFVIFVIALIVFLIWLIRHQRSTTSETQSAISDRDLLRRIAGQPDGFVTPASLSEQTQLSKGVARIRLQALHQAGILDQAHNAGLTSYYSLRHPLTDREITELSPEPFLTVEDVITLFELYDYRPRDQDLILSTGLPLRLIRREMKYFADQGVVDTLFASDGYGKQSQRIYVLKEPYRSQPDQFRGRAEADNLELRTILRNDNFIV